MEKEQIEQIEQNNLLEKLWIAFLVVLFIGGLFEIGLVIYGFVNADRVECNLLWCSFISEKSYSSVNSIKSVNSECYINGERVNCSDFIGDEHFCENGGDYNSNLECIERIVKGGFNSSKQ